MWYQVHKSRIFSSLDISDCKYVPINFLRFFSHIKCCFVNPCAYRLISLNNIKMCRNQGRRLSHDSSRYYNEKNVLALHLFRKTLTSIYFFLEERIANRVYINTPKQLILDFYDCINDNFYAKSVVVLLLFFLAQK